MPSKPAPARRARRSSASDSEKSQRTAAATRTPAWRSSELASAANAGLRSMRPEEATATRPDQHAPHLSEGPPPVGQELQPLPADDHIERAVAEREARRVARCAADVQDPIAGAEVDRAQQVALPRSAERGDPRRRRGSPGGRAHRAHAPARTPVRDPLVRARAAMCLAMCSASRPTPWIIADDIE